MHREAPKVAMVWCPYTTPERVIDSYYPGDRFVDWVGVNMYNVTYHDQDRRKPASHIHPTDMLDYVYKKYSARKPIMIGEYGTTHWSALESKSVPVFARRNIFDLYAALPRKYPRVKCISYFNGNNLVLEHRQNNNYAVTQNESVLKAYKQVVDHPYFLSQIQDPGAFPFMSVDASVDPVAVAPVGPRLLKSGETVTGKLDLSAFCKSVDPGITMKFKIDGKLLYEGEDRSKWYVTIGVSRLTEGWHTFSVEAWKGKRRLDRYSARVNVVH